MTTPQALQGKRALLAEDDELLSLALAECLRSYGIQVDEVRDGRAAVERASGQAYDWILLDVQMPVMDGLTAAKQLRTLPFTRERIIIAATGNGDADSRQQCRDAGMDDLIVKPADPEQLASMLLAWLERRPPAAPQLAPAEPAPAAADLGKLAQLARGEPARARKFADQFRAGIETGFSEIETAFTANDLAAVAATAHRLKSNARWVGALRLGDALASLEAAGKAALAAAAQQHFAECRLASADFFPKLQAFLDDLEQGSGAAP